MASTADFKNGLVLQIDGQLWQITEFQHVKPGKGPAFVRTKLKNVLSGKVVDKTYNAGVKVETATVDRRDTTYLYRDGTDSCSWTARTSSSTRYPNRWSARPPTTCRFAVDAEYANDAGFGAEAGDLDGAFLRDAAPEAAKAVPATLLQVRCRVSSWVSSLVVK